MEVQDPNPSPLLLLPGELVIQIISFLKVPEVLAIRQTCTSLAQISRTRLIWLSLLKQQALTWHEGSLTSSEITDAALESGVIEAYRTAQSWPRLRRRASTVIPRAGDLLLSFEVFLERWLICAYSEGLVYLWDLGRPRISNAVDVPPYPRRCASLDLGSRNWASMVASLDASQKYVILAITRATVPAITRIYRVALRESSTVFDTNDFKHLDTLVSPFAQTARTIDPYRKILVLSSANSVDVVNTNTGSFASPDTMGKAGEVVMSVSAQTEDVEEVFNAVVDSKIIDEYLVVFKSRSLELHPFTQPSCGLPPMIHHFPSLTFRSLTSSQCLSTTQGFSFNFMGYDFLHGIFHFVAHVHRVPQSLEVTCLGVYPMSDTINTRALAPLLSSASTNDDSSELSGSQQVTDSQWASALFGHRTLGSTAGGSRGFVSALALGPQGKRAVWIERKRGSTVREVLVWAQDPAGEQTPGLVVIPRCMVHRVVSYDLRADLTHCAIAEVSGRIVLGNRIGELFVLDV
ncbi:hypothetical protein H0H81_011867 [Sphagnurus paluster]|uniref:F-box domain-containing protein n=1 Tax=Sphagnurus paluster TaxID=117069 RepID=A0A9P7KJA1_9AGAR|nr:hypothetical protein H0H81_011867 [Sphagnurus paluster]